jgi:hypothetical protein
LKGGIIKDLNDASFEEITGKLRAFSFEEEPNSPGINNRLRIRNCSQGKRKWRKRMAGAFCGRAGQMTKEQPTLDVGSNVSNDSMRELEELLTKLNPLAKEFIAPSHFDASSTTLATLIPKQNSRMVIDVCPFFYSCFRLLHDF